MTTAHQDPERLDLPSGSDPAFGKCPGKRRLLDTLNNNGSNNAPDPPDEDAALGTKIHQAFATGNTLPLSPDEHEIYSKGVKFTEDLVNRWMADNNLSTMTEGEREIRLWCHHPTTLDPICSGQLDRHYISGTHAAIIDLKGGWGTYVPRTNASMQLRVYAVLLWLEYPELTRIRVAFAKPRSFRGGTEDFTDYTVPDLQMSEQAIRFYLWETQQDDSERRAGAWCRYCHGRSHCPEAGAWSMLPSVLAKAPGRLKRGESVSIDHLAPNDLLRIYRASTVVRKILDAVSDRLKSWSDEQLSEIGMTHGKPREYLEWHSAKGVFDFLTKQEGWTEEESFSVLDVGLTKLVQLTMKQKGLAEDEAKAVVKSDLQEFFTVKQGEPGLKALK